MAKNITIDLFDCSGYSSLSVGTHSLKLRSKYLTKTSPESSPTSIYVDGLPRNYLTFSSPQAFRLSSMTKSWNGKIYYSTDELNWTEWSGSSNINAVLVSGVYKLFLCGLGNTSLNFTNSNHFIFSNINGSTPQITISGNIETLLDYALVDSGSYVQDIQEGAFAYCFAERNYAHYIYDASNLILPRTSLVKRCYSRLFYSQDNLEFAPILPATDLAENCYEYMFAYCSSLTIAPQLPALILERQCYSYMFAFCSSLTTAPSLPATTLARSCYEHMFQGCSSLEYAPNITATIMEEYCCQHMFENCTSLIDGGIINATTLAGYCFYYMYSGCSSLSTSPSLNATTLASSCYAFMFNGTNAIPDTSNIDFTSSSVVNSAGLIGLFAGTKITDADLRQILPYDGTTGETYLPVNMNVLGASYKHMFENCTLLKNPPQLPSTIIVEGGYLEMFKGCTSLLTTPRLPATTVSGSAYYGMFEGCISLTTLPELPATTIYSTAYKRMFYGCTGIKLSATQTGNYQIEYRIPKTGSGSATYSALDDMFTGTGGTFAGTPSLNTTYYLERQDDAYLTFTAPVNFSANFGELGYDGELYYSTDGTWHRTGGNPIITTNNYVMLRGIGNTRCYGVNNGISLTVAQGYTVQCFGHIETLQDGEKYRKGETISSPANFTKLFQNCTGLGNTPILSPTQVDSYRLMFKNCLSLTTVSSFDATEFLSYYACENMFEGCISLVNLPASLPATDLEVGCYLEMFKGCSSLTTAPSLPATTLKTACYEHMFENCTSLVSPPALPATTLESLCYYGMFKGCSSLVDLPQLPATTIKGYNFMFEDCVSIKLSATQDWYYTEPYRIPSSGTGTDDGSMYGMFRGTGGTFAGTPTVNTTYYRFVGQTLTLNSGEKVDIGVGIADLENSLIFSISSGMNTIAFYLRKNTQICETSFFWFGYGEITGVQENDVIHIYKFPSGDDYKSLNYNYAESNVPVNYRLCDLKYVNGSWTILNDYTS